MDIWQITRFTLLTAVTATALMVPPGLLLAWLLGWFGGAEVPPPNDYHVRNADKRLRTLSVAPGAPATVNVHAGSGSSATDTPTTLGRLAGTAGLRDGLFRVTLTGDRVTRLAELYLP